MLPLAFILYFLIYSLFGWIIDTSYRSYKGRKFVDGGFFPYLPLCPIYGFGAMIVLGANQYLHSFPLFGQWLIYVLVLAAFEYASGDLILHVFHKRLWNYRKNAFHIGTFTDLFHAAAWGTFAILLIRYVHPYLESIIVLF